MLGLDLENAKQLGLYLEKQSKPAELSAKSEEEVAKPAESSA
jgi:hypothetical protein